MTAGRVALPTLLAYAPPAFALGVPLFFVQFFLLKFATDVLLLAPAVVGTIFAVAKFWDAALDPIIGTWSDRLRSRMGRRRPFMLAGIPAARRELLDALDAARRARAELDGGLAGGGAARLLCRLLHLRDSALRARGRADR